MSFNVLIVLTLVARLTVCTIIQEGYAQNRNFTVDNLIGTWYTIAAFSTSYRSDNVITCFRVIVSSEPGFHQNFKEGFRFRLNGQRKSYVAFGVLDGYDAQLVFPYFSEKSAYSIMIYNDGRELILREKTAMPSYILRSRLTSVSSATKQKFEQFAEASGAHAVYFNHTGCPYERVPPRRS